MVKGTTLEQYIAATTRPAAPVVALTSKGPLTRLRHFMRVHVYPQPVESAKKTPSEGTKCAAAFLVGAVEKGSPGQSK